MDAVAGDIGAPRSPVTSRRLPSDLRALSGFPADGRLGDHALARITALLTPRFTKLLMLYPILASK